MAESKPKKKRTPAQLAADKKRSAAMKAKTKKKKGGKKTASKKKGKKRRRKYHNWSVSKLFKDTIQYANITGKDPWEQMELVVEVLLGDGTGEDLLDEIKDTVSSTQNNLKNNALKTIAYGILIEWGYKQLRESGVIPRSKVWTFGKHRITW